MADNSYNTVDSVTGTQTFDGPSEITKGNHNNMPARTSAYLPTDERGHIQASSLGGSNSRDNIAPQARDLNHGSWYNMENAERGALRSGSTIDTEKTAFVSNQPGGRPDAFMANTSISFPSGQTQEIHLSFSNMQNNEQLAINEEVMAQASDMMNASPNPGDGLRDSMSPEEYADLMEETDAALPNIADYYAEWDYQGVPSSAVETGEPTADWDGGVSATPNAGDVGAVSADDPGIDTAGADLSGSDDGAGASADDED